jgi:predicted dehydrogenase
MKFMIAGLGSIGRRHLRNLKAEGITDFVLLRSHKSTLPDEELAGIPIETGLEQALAYQPKAVIISNPTALHLDVALAAARSGCHLFIEKPVSHSMERMDELQAEVARNRCQVLVGYHFRYHPGLEQVKGLLEAQAIGRLLSVHAHWGEYLPGWHPWEDYRQGYSARADLGGGVILTLSHPLDYLRWLLGEVETMWAFAGQLSDLELQVEDTAEIGLRFTSGVLGSLHLDYCQRPPAHFLEIIGEQGTLRWNHSSGVALYQADKPGWQEIPLSSGFERNQLFTAEMHHFIGVIEGREQPRCTLEDGLQALRLALAAQKSSQEQSLVRLDPVQ